MHTQEKKKTSYQRPNQEQTALVKEGPSESLPLSSLTSTSHDKKPEYTAEQPAQITILGTSNN